MPFEDAEAPAATLSRSRASAAAARSAGAATANRSLTTVDHFARMTGMGFSLLIRSKPYAAPP